MASFLVTVAIMPKLPLQQGQVPKKGLVPKLERPGGEFFYLIWKDGELSHRVLYHDIGPSIDNARNADVLIFGNSRMQLGLRGNVLVPKAEAEGIDLFGLGCGNSEKIQFALELIRRHDLRPKIFIASGGPEFYSEGKSKIADWTMGISRWEAWRGYFETQGAWALRSRLHRYLPKLDMVGEVPIPRWIIYRSERTGFWLPLREMTFLTPVSPGEELADYQQVLPLAAELHREVSQRGGLLVLTMVPFHRYQSGHLPYLAEELDVPYVLPSIPGLITSDRQHLTKESAQLYSEAFWEEFMAEPRVRQRLQLAPPGPSAAR
ncbi:MAG: hypothetical protein MPN21_03885 [Thermoanaerobaculia bacterium]|nr:hypothetical protein [Thermoanaerobaculia bacterium]